MSCYWIARARIFDKVAYKQYTDRVPAILKKYGGKVLTRGAAHETLEGPDYFERFVVIEFETMSAARRCFNSPEYIEAAAFRRSGAGQNELTIADAGDLTD
jgi:uncharacterized protein (DUF1330 family)